MTHEELVAGVAKRLEWPEEKISDIIRAILEVVSAELKMNNTVVIDDFGTLKTDIQPEYILVDTETGDRYLMPPAMEVIFESLFQESEDSTLLPAFFTLDEVLYNEINNSFSQFEPTLLNEGVQFPGIPEIVVGKQETEDETPELSLSVNLQSEKDTEYGIPGEEMESVEFKEEMESVESVEFEVTAEEAEIVDPPEITEPSEITEPEKISGRIELFARVEPVDAKESPPGSRSHRQMRNNKRTSSIWIPIAGGIAIVMASLFFFKGTPDKQSGDNS